MEESGCYADTAAKLMRSCMLERSNRESTAVVMEVSTGRPSIMAYRHGATCVRWPLTLSIMVSSSLAQIMAVFAARMAA
jgi:hypothetical protein